MSQDRARKLLGSYHAWFHVGQYVDPERAEGFVEEVKNDVSAESDLPSDPRALAALLRQSADKLSDGDTSLVLLVNESTKLWVAEYEVRV